MKLRSKQLTVVVWLAVWVRQRMETVWCCVNIILDLYNKFYYFSLVCVNLLKMSTKHEFKLEMFVAVNWMVGWLVSLFNGLSTFVGYLRPELFS